MLSAPPGSPAALSSRAKWIVTDGGAIRYSSGSMVGLPAGTSTPSRRTALCLGRPARLPVGRLLVRPADAQRHALVPGVADDMKRCRQARRGEAVGHRESAQPEVVHGAGEARGGARLRSEERRVG